MGLPLAGESSLPIPRATRSWPKAQPKPATAASAPPAAFATAVAAAATAGKARPIPAAPTPASPPAQAREASSVATAFSTWKQVTAAKTSVAGQAEPAATAAVVPASVPAARREDPVLFIYRAAAKQARGEHEAAIADLTRAIELDPLCTTAWAGRGMSMEAIGDVAGAKRDYSKAIEIELKQEIARQARTIS